MGIWAWDGSSWRSSSDVSVYDGGTWKAAEQVWVYDSGSWHPLLDVAPATAPTLSAAPVADTDSEIVLTIGPVTDATEYDVEWAQSVSEPTSGTVISDVGTSGSYTHVGRAADTSYWYRARGVNTQGDGPWSGWVQAYTHVTAPGVSASEDFANCPAQLDLVITLDHDNGGGDSRGTAGTWDLSDDGGSTWSAGSGTFGGGQTSVTAADISASVDRVRAKYNGESTYTIITPLLTGCPA